MKQKRSNQPSLLHPWAVLGFFGLLAVIITYPTAARLSDFVVFATDPLLEAWTLKWDIYALLSGRSLWEANIFYPYAHTLAFSEHLLPTAFILMPFTLLGDTPLVSVNLGVLFTTALSGYGMYLLVTWLTGNRWAGLVAGVFYAVAPYRMGHIIQLHLLSTQWLPLACLVLARLIQRRSPTDLFLLLIFTNLQFFSAVNYAPLSALVLGIWGLFWLIAYRRQITLTLIGYLALFGLLTLALNWPVLRQYNQVSDHMGVVRSLGDARLYGASLAHYVQPMANSLLYVRWLNLPGLIDSATPGLVVLTLAVVGVVFSWAFKADKGLKLAVLALLVIILTGLTLSFGANELALGETLAPLTARLLPYPYLYDYVPLLQGLRAPIRFAWLVTFALAVLAGIGLAALARRGWLTGPRLAWVAGLVGLLILLEHLPAPLPGEAVPYGRPLSVWLAGQPPQTAVAQLPYHLHTNQSFLELGRVYESALHFQPILNGASGFKPAWLVKLGPLLDTFPDGPSLDALRQLGVQVVMLQRDQVDPAAWDNLMGLWPGYLPAIESLHSAGDDLALRLRPPACQPDLNRVQIDAAAFPVLSFTNLNPAAFVADPQQVSILTTPTERREFLEPLLIAPGQTVTMTLPVENPPGDWQIDLANLGQTLTPANPRPSVPVAPAPPKTWQPVEIPFANEVALQQISLTEPVQPCADLNLALQWRWPAAANAVIRVELLDHFNRVAASQELQPTPAETLTTHHALPLVETTPPGLYQLRVRLLDAAGNEIPPLGPDGQPAPIQVSLPVVVRPGVERLNVEGSNVDALLANGVSLKGVEIGQTQIRPGDWLRFTLIWQAEAAPAGDFTVFTQLIGPDGKVWGQHDNPPKGGWYPTSLWQPGEPVTDDYALRLDPAAPPGPYRLIVGMYNPATGERVKAATGGDFIEAEQLSVEGP